jgi:type VI secretion system FHA domain protein
MSLTLIIENVDKLDNGEPVQLKLDRHGAVIGRSPHSDWSLPDTKNYISSTHCEIDFRGGAYVLIDRSTNGTYLNDSHERMAGPHNLADKDVIQIGPYRIVARTAGGASAKAEAAPAPAAAPWGSWEPAKPAPSAASRWDAAASAPAPRAAPPAPEAQGWSPAPGAGEQRPSATTSPGGWDDPAPAKASGGWDDPAPAKASGGSGWDAVSTAGPAGDPWEDHPKAAVSGRGPMAQNWNAPAAQAPAADDPWARFSSSHDVDWARGFDAPPPAAGPSPAPGPAPSAPAASPAGDAAWFAFLAAAGLSEASLKASPQDSATTAGGLLKRLVAGLVVMIEARARAKAQLGAQSTTLELNGNNPIKFARSPDKALEQLLNPPERGFMDANLAIEDSFRDLQAHQMATLAAMQGALRATLERFSPSAISTRAETRGLLAKILPGARNAALWDAYQKEFDGVAQGSDEAFLDVFSKAFREAYDRASSEIKLKGR